MSTVAHQHEQTEESPGNGFHGKRAGRAVLSRFAPKRGPSPFLVIGTAFVVGVAVAKWIDWRGHAHPR